MSNSMVNVWTAKNVVSKDTNRVLRLLDLHEIQYRLIDISEFNASERDRIHCSLALDTGFNKLPNIYVGQDYHVGGIDDLKSYLQSPKTMQRLLSTI